MALSKALQIAIRFASVPQYRLAQRIGLHPSTLSTWVNGIYRVRDKDPRVCRLGKLLGLSPEECFAPDPPTDAAVDPGGGDEREARRA